MNEIVKFILDNYKDITPKQAEIIYNIFKDRTIEIYEDGKMVTLGMYLKLDDETLGFIKDGILDVTHPVVARYCSSQNGKNIHFFLCISNKVKLIIRGIRMLINKEHPKTISWFSPDMKDFFIRRYPCQFQS